MKPLQDSDPRDVGPYHLEGVLGQGGMGRVYLGVDENGRRVAVKVVYAELVRDEDFRKRFTREASATAAISGRFIAQVVASDLEASPPWLATEYIDGPSLHDQVAEHGGALSPSRAQEIAASLAEALGTIHAAGVVHRDVKPANVLIGPDGAYLIDFGIAREATASTITRTGTVVGTPPFMAPEQIRGRRTLGPAADIFAFGGVLAYAITGRHPFGEGDNTSLAYRIVHDEPDLDGVEDEILKALVLACLAKDPEQRPTATEVQARLAAVATRMITRPEEGTAAADAKDATDATDATVAIDDSERSVPAGSPPAAERRRRWVVVALATAAILAISAGILGVELGTGKHPRGSDKTALSGGNFPTAATDPASDSSTPGNTSPDGQPTTSGSHSVPSSSTTTTTTSLPAPTADQGGGPNPPPGTTTAISLPAPPALTSTTTTSTTSTSRKPPPPTTSGNPHPTSNPPPPTSANPSHGNPPAAPTGANAAVGTASDFSGFVVTFSWQPVSGATSYDIHYTNNGTSTGGKTTDTILHADGTSYQLSGWQAYPTGFCFNVRAVNANGVSAWDASSPHCM